MKKLAQSDDVIMIFEKLKIGVGAGPKHPQKGLLKCNSVFWYLILVFCVILGFFFAVDVRFFVYFFLVFVLLFRRVF